VQVRLFVYRPSSSIPPTLIILVRFFSSLNISFPPTFIFFSSNVYSFSYYFYSETIQLLKRSFLLRFCGYQTNRDSRHRLLSLHCRTQPPVFRRMRSLSQCSHLLPDLLGTNSNYGPHPFLLYPYHTTLNAPSAHLSPPPYNVVHQLGPALVNHGFRQRGGSPSFPFPPT
jgi:hypothetical protein